MESKQPGHQAGASFLSGAISFDGGFTNWYGFALRNGVSHSKVERELDHWLRDDRANYGIEALAAQGIEEKKCGFYAHSVSHTSDESRFRIYFSFR